MDDTCAVDECCPAIEPMPPITGSSGDEAELAEIAKALGHPMRVRILRILAGRRSCLCGEIVEMLPIAQATVSQHLQVLKEAGLVRGEIEGPRVCYCLSRDRLTRLSTLLELLRLPLPVHEPEVIRT